MPPPEFFKLRADTACPGVNRAHFTIKLETIRFGSIRWWNDFPLSHFMSVPHVSIFRFTHFDDYLSSKFNIRHMNWFDPWTIRWFETLSHSWNKLLPPYFWRTWRVFAMSSCSHVIGYTRSRVSDTLRPLCPLIFTRDWLHALQDDWYDTTPKFSRAALSRVRNWGNPNAHVSFREKVSYTIRTQILTCRIHALEMSYPIRPPNFYVPHARIKTIWGNQGSLRGSNYPLVIRRHVTIRYDTHFTFFLKWIHNFSPIVANRNSDDSLDGDAAHSPWELRENSF